MFPIIDITHKPKRKQADNLRDTESMMTIQQQNTDKDSCSSNGVMLYEVPEGFITLEKAIAFYEKNSEVTLFKFTAQWLNDFLVYRKAAIKEARKQAEAEEVSNEEAE